MACCDYSLDPASPISFLSKMMAIFILKVTLKCHRASNITPPLTYLHHQNESLCPAPAALGKGSASSGKPWASTK